MTTFGKVRIVMSPLSVAGFLCSGAAYLGSFLGLTVDQLGIWLAPLLIGLFLSFVSVLIAERFQTSGSGFTNAFKDAVPKWAWFTQFPIMALAILQIVLVFFGDGAQGSPTIMDGQYVLDNHGVLTAVTRAEYLRAGGEALRSMAAIWMLFFYVDAVYWSFVKKPLQSKAVSVESTYE